MPSTMPESASEIFEKLGIDPDNLPDDAPRVPPEHVALLLRNIGGILHQSESFRALGPDQQQQIMANTERIAAALAEPPEISEVEAEPGSPAGVSPTPVHKAVRPCSQDPYAIPLS